MDMDAELPEAAAGGIVKGPLTGESRNIEVGADVSEVAEDPSWNPFNNADAKVEAGGGDKSKAQELDSGMAEEKGPLKQPEEEESRTSDAEVGNMEQLSRKEDGVDVPQSAVDVEHLTLDSGTSSSPAPIPSHHVAVPLLNNATPELLRLIDSVIQGSETGASIRLHKLLAEDGGPPYTVANEAVDILLAKMGWEDRSSASHTDGAVPQVGSVILTFWQSSASLQLHELMHMSICKVTLTGKLALKVPGW